MRRIALIAAILCGSLFFAGTAAAANHRTVTETQTAHGSWVETGDTNPCTGDDVTVDATGNRVSHDTYFVENGQPTEFWSTFTEAFRFSFTDQGVIYAGRATVWGGFNLNQRNQNQTFTFSIRGTGSDGSSVTGNETMHFALNANGQLVVSFDKMNFTCG